jgi:prophage regulatory protein
MTLRVPNLDELAEGRLTLLEESHAEYCTVKLQLVRHGLRLADETTWRAWRRFRWVELWQAVALQMHLDPETVAWHSLGMRYRSTLSLSQLFGIRIRTAIQHAVHESLPTLEVAEELRRTRVRPWEFAVWCDDMRIPCPAELPRAEPSGKATAPADGGKSKRRATAPSDEFVRQADLIPKMLPFSPATLWRKVGKGEFPQPNRMSTRMTVWRRSEIEEWLGSWTPKAKSRSGKTAR